METQKIQDDLSALNRKLSSQEEEKGKRAEELLVANRDLAFQKDEKGKRAEELVIANKELAFQAKEKGKRADELIIANEELAFQNEEKGKRADELVIANEELAFQNEEKAKRADELIIANEELAFQNEEKGKRADELVIANKELAFQNDEKGKRAEELIVANKELAFQNDEKEKRADELIVANKELAFQNKEKGKRAKELISYKHFFYNSMDLACFASLEGYFEELNESFVKALGYTAKELTEKKFIDFIHPDDIENTLKNVENLSSGIKTSNFINRYKTKAGAYLHIEWNSVFNQETKKIYATGRDITEKMIRIRDLDFQNLEKEKRAAELVIANIELAFQNNEKEKRAAELAVANEELAFQNDEKGKRADELTAYKHFFYNSMDLACFATPEGFFEEINESFTKALGYTTKELTEKKFLEYVHPDDIEATLNELVSQSLGIQTFNFTNRFRTKSGTYLHIEWNSVFNNETRKIYATGRDITEKIIAAKELAFQNEEKGKRADELIIANKELAFQSDEKGKRAEELIIANNELAFQNNEKGKRADELVIANKELAFQNEEKGKRAEELIIANKELAFQNDEKGKRAEELIIANNELAFQNDEKGKRAEELIIANNELAFQNDEKGKRAEELIIANKELAFQNDEKGKRAMELIVANKELAFQNEEKGKRAKELIIANKELAFQNKEKGKRAEELSIANAELKKAEAEIRQFNEELELKVIERTAELEVVNKELGSFSYSVSHDLRAPIRAINGYARILEEDHAEELGEDGSSVLNSIIQNSKKMGQLIDDLLAFSKLGRKEVDLVDVNMNAMVKSIKEELLYEDRKNQTEFRINALPPAKGDPSLIKQVWINLISNAVKYSQYKPKAQVEIGAFEKDKYLVYFVKDNGAGFDMTYYDKLFGVFQRLHSQEEFEGTGIGLAIVQKIVSRHKGTVWAESVLNEGTCFYFSLPNINT